MISSITSGFLIGLMGSFHCAGMCGPLALALPIHTDNKWKRFFLSLSYNLGRVLTYSLLGLLFGLLGKKLFIGKGQQYFSIVLGVLILLAVIKIYLLPKVNIPFPLYDKFNAFIKTNIARYIKNDDAISLLIIGVLNGFLPCGLVYVAIATALAAGSLSGSILIMAFFGLGTLPMMSFIVFVGKSISFNWRLRIQKLIPVFISAMAVILILRGLNLGVPYLSPKLEKSAAGTEAECCHRK